MILFQILQFIQDNSSAIRGVVMQRECLVIVLVTNQRVFDLSTLSLTECMHIASRIDSIDHMRCKK